MICELRQVKMTPAREFKADPAHTRGAAGGPARTFFQSTQIINLTSRPHFIVRSRKPDCQGCQENFQPSPNYFVTVHVDTSSCTAESGCQYKATQRIIS